MTDAYLAREIVSACFWFATTVSILLVLEVCLGDIVRERVRRFLDETMRDMGKSDRALETIL